MQNTELINFVKSIGERGLIERLTPEEVGKAKKNIDDIIPIAINLGSNKDYRWGINNDDFIADITGYNALGAIYPALDEGARKKVSTAIGLHFDYINYLYVQINHTPYIREPLLLADIARYSNFYWPSLEEGKKITSKYTTFEELSKIILGDGLLDPKKVRSDFCVTFAALRTDMSNYGKELINKLHPDFFARVIEGISKLNFEGLDILKQILPEKLHKELENKYNLYTHPTFNNI